MHRPRSSPPRRSPRSSLLATTCTALTLLLAAPAEARADEDEEARRDVPVRVLLPTAVRLGGAIFANQAESFVFGNVTVARQLLERLALEGSAGGGGTRFHHGPHLGLTARGTIFGRYRNAFTAELGAHAAFLKLGAPLAFGHAGLAFEVRTESGLSLVAGGGLALALSNSRRRRTPGCESDAQGCYRYRAGDSGLWATVQAGTSF